MRGRSYPLVVLLKSFDDSRICRHIVTVVVTMLDMIMSGFVVEFRWFVCFNVTCVSVYEEIK